MGRKRTKTTDALYNTNAIYTQYYNRLMELSISMFEWLNLPDSVDARFLELTLFEKGQAVFLKDDVLGELALPCATRAPFNVYNVPIHRRAYASNGYQNELNEDNSVIIYNNMIRTNSVLDVRMFAKRLYELDMIIEVNSKAQKTPVLVVGNEQQRLTLLNVYQAYEGNEPVIFGDKNLDINALKVLKTDAPYIADKLYQLKTQYWNEALTYLGISNVNNQKKERLITDEAIRSSGGTIASRYSRLESRRQAVEKINDMFGLDIEVNYRQDYREADDEVMMDGATGTKNMEDMVVDLRTK